MAASNSLSQVVESLVQNLFKFLSPGAGGSGKWVVGVLAAALLLGLGTLAARHKARMVLDELIDSQYKPGDIPKAIKQSRKAYNIVVCASAVFALALFYFLVR